ncbi:MAG: DUF2157 domain-containing protein [Pseudomonadota bacterium]
MATLLERQINDWLKRGVIDESTADVLRADVVSKTSPGILTKGEKSRFSFFKVLAVFAVLSFVAGILLSIAANWDAIPRLVKVCGIAILIILGFVGGAIVRKNGGSRLNAAGWARHTAFFEEILYTIGGAAYIGGVALVGQMYHLSGSLDKAMFGFGVGLVIAGALVRSRMVTLGALFCASWWYLNSAAPANLLSWAYVCFAAIVALSFVVAHIRNDRWLRRACALAALLSLVPLAFEVLEVIYTAYRDLPSVVKIILWHVVLIASVWLLGIHRYRPALLPNSIGRYLGVSIAFAIGLVAVIFLHAVWRETLFLVLAISYGVAFSVCSLVLHGVEHRPLRYFAYILFVGEIALLFGDTIIGLLNSSAILIVLSGILALLAFAFYRVERRLNAMHEGDEHDG